MTTAAAGNVAGQAGEKEKEKTGMRRALGRGLASLLPGPRVVPPAPPTSGPAAPASTTGRAAEGAAGISTSASAPAPSAPGSVATAAVIAPTAVPSPAEVRADSATRSGAAAPHAPTVQVTPSASLGAEAVAAHVDGNTVRVMQPADTPNDEAARADASGHLTAAVPTAVSTLEAAAATSADPVDGMASEMEYAEWMELTDGASAAGPIEIQAVTDTRAPANLLVALAIRDIDRNPFQTREVEDDDALQELADSIKTQGVVQPIVVRPAEDQAGRYILILGERRLLASKKAGKSHIPAIVRKVSAQQAAEMTIIENLQREDLSPLEQAQAFKVLSLEFNMTQQEIAQRVGLSRESIANYMRLLKLPHEVLEMLALKQITFAKAKELLKLGDNDRIAEAALFAVKKGMNIEQIERLVMSMDGLLDPLPDMPGVQKKKEGGGARWVDPNVRAAQMDLERTLGLRVRIRDRKGKGKIVIEYSSVDDYERVVEMLRGKS